jgi:DNA-binding Xre family transcriptional regulator
MIPGETTRDLMNPQVQFASNLQLLERAGREIRLKTVAKLARALEITAGKLCAGIIWEPTKRRFE